MIYTLLLSNSLLCCHKDLYYASYDNNTSVSEFREIVKLYPMQINKPDATGQTPLSRIAGSLPTADRIKIISQKIEILLDNGADPNIHNPFRSPIGEAIKVLGDFEKPRYKGTIVKLLLDHNANPDIALVIAAQYGRFDIVLDALTKGAEPNYIAHSDTKDTALHWVVRKCHYPNALTCIEHLLDKGAHPYAKNSSGITPSGILNRKLTEIVTSEQSYDCRCMQKQLQPIEQVLSLFSKEKYRRPSRCSCIIL